jgi:hypothetical protein
MKFSLAATPLQASPAGAGMPRHNGKVSMLAGIGKGGSKIGDSSVPDSIAPEVLERDDLFRMI